VKTKEISQTITHSTQLHTHFIIIYLSSSPYNNKKSSTIRPSSLHLPFRFPRLPTAQPAVIRKVTITESEVIEKLGQFH
jgi:hypothetical protein